MKRNGFVNIAIIITGVVLLIGTTGYFIMKNENILLTPTPSPTAISNQTPSPTIPIITESNLISTSTTIVTGDIKEIYSLLEKEDWVKVLVGLNGNEFTAPNLKSDAKKLSEVKKIINATLSTLTQNDFRLPHLQVYSPIFSGEISKSGIDKLINNPQVKTISINRVRSFGDPIPF
jgi:flagellar basal body-associated protein FliL